MDGQLNRWTTWRRQISSPSDLKRRSLRLFELSPQQQQEEKQQDEQRYKISFWSNKLQIHVCSVTYIPQSEICGSFGLRNRKSILDLLQLLVDGDRFQVFEVHDAAELCRHHLFTVVFQSGDALIRRASVLDELHVLTLRITAPSTHQSLHHHHHRHHQFICRRKIIHVQRCNRLYSCLLYTSPSPRD